MQPLHVHKPNPLLTLAPAAVSYNDGGSPITVNNYSVLRLSWPSKSFVESDTTQSAVEARLGMFPDGGIYANMPSIGDCVITCSSTEVEALAHVRIDKTASSSEPSPAHRCDQILTSLLLSVAQTNTSGFRGLPIDAFFNPDDASDDAVAASPLKFTGWPNMQRLQQSSAMQQHAHAASTELQPPYLPNHCDNFNPTTSARDERAALRV